MNKLRTELEIIAKERSLNYTTLTQQTVPLLSKRSVVREEREGCLNSSKGPSPPFPQVYVQTAAIEKVIP